MSLYHKSIESLIGTNGLIIGNEDEKLKDHPIQITDALLWLKSNNHFYKKLFSNYELINGHFLPTSTNTSFPGLRCKT